MNYINATNFNKLIADDEKCDIIHTLDEIMNMFHQVLPWIGFGLRNSFKVNKYEKSKHSFDQTESSLSIILWLVSVLAVIHVKRIQTQLCYKHLITLTACGLRTVVDIASDSLNLYVQKNSDRLHQGYKFDNETDLIQESTRSGKHLFFEVY